MARVTLRTDESAYARAVRMAHGAARAPEAWPEALAATADYIGATGAMFVTNDFVGSGSWLISARLDDHLTRLYLDRHTRNPSVLAAVRAGPGIHATHAITDLAALHRSAFGVEVLRPLHIKSMFQLSHAALTTSSTAGGLGFTLDARQFDDEAAIGRRLRRIAPQLRIAVDLYLSGASWRRAANTRNRQLNLLAEPALTTAADGRLLATNTAADALLDAGEVLRHGRGETVSLGDDRDSRRLHRALAIAALHERGMAFELATPAGWLVIVTPYAEPGDGIAVTPGRALVRLIEADADHRRRAQTAGAIFALTRRETDVLAQLAAGRSVAETAQALRVTPETVRTHVKALFGKTGVNSQARLAQLVARLPGPIA